MRQKYGYYHGRFQPFHNGHLANVKKMLENHEEIIIGISNPFRLPAVFEEGDSAELRASVEKGRKNENNPYTFWQRMTMIRKSLDKEGIDLGRVMIVPNATRNGLPADEMIPARDDMVIYSVPKQVHNKEIIENRKKMGYEVVTLEKVDTPTGGKIREMIKEGDVTWKEFVPEGTVEVVELAEKKSLSKNG
ncbi:MAG: adenylyltransferase/cytidyltransferase family protein [bacterium]|nr:adenylyltransferase/cytidyltransferase family protein [bacterium]